MFSGVSSQSFKQILKKTHLINSSLITILQQKSTTNGAIESFTAELVEEKVLRWEAVKKRTLDKCIYNKNAINGGITVVTKSILSDYENLKKSDLWLDVRRLSAEQVNSLLATALDISNDDDLFYLMRQCLNWKIPPARSTVIKCLEKFSLMGRLDLIEDLALLFKEKDKFTFGEYGNFESFVGISLWKKGDLESALTVLVNSYKKQHSSNETSQKLLNSAFTLISADTLKTKSEAVLIRLVRSAEFLYREHENKFVVSCVWKNCFESEWFSDQEIADRLFDDFEVVRNIVYKRTTSLCYNFLRKNNVDAVHRLIQLFLRHENKNACKACLNLLFEYNYWRRDLRACGEILRNSLELEIPLSKEKSEKLLNLLLNQPSLLAKKPVVMKFEYKF